jgi:hypothetical protein
MQILFLARVYFTPITSSSASRITLPSASRRIYSKVFFLGLTPCAVKVDIPYSGGGRVWAVGAGMDWVVEGWNFWIWLESLPVKKAFLMISSLFF